MGIWFDEKDSPGAACGGMLLAPYKDRMESLDSGFLPGSSALPLLLLSLNKLSSPCPAAVLAPPPACAGVQATLLELTWEEEVNHSCWWKYASTCGFTLSQFSFKRASVLTSEKVEQYYVIACQNTLLHLHKQGLPPPPHFPFLAYLSKLRCWGGCWERVGHHGAEYIQVIVALVCARATIVSWCSCRHVCKVKVEKLVELVQNMPKPQKGCVQKTK